MSHQSCLLVAALCVSFLASSEAFLPQNTVRRSFASPIVAQKVLFSEASSASADEAGVAPVEAEVAPVEAEVAPVAAEVAPVDAPTEEVAVVEESAEPVAAAKPKRVIKRDRHTLFVGNLPFDTTDVQVRDIFAESGTVELVSVPKDRVSGQTRGFAFVDMASLEECQAAIDAVDGSDISGRTLRVQISLPKDQVKKEPVKRFDEGMKKIYVGNLNFDTTREELKEYYGTFGAVSDVYIPRDSSTGDSRGFAFITMEEAGIEKAIEDTNGVVYGGRELAVSLPLPPGSKAPRAAAKKKLYVGNLSFYTSIETLRELFEEFGEVHDCYMPEDTETGDSRGFGFVTMDPEAALNAIDETDGCEIDGRIIRVNEAQPKGARVAYENEEEDNYD